MRARSAGALVATLLATACRGEEGRQVVGAVETFVGFGMSNEERAKAPSSRPRPPPHAHERSREIDQRARGGPVLRVEVDLPHQLSAAEVEAVLGAELDRVLGERRAARVEVRGRPAGLVLHGGVMGLASGERGRDGGVVTRELRVLLDDRAPPLRPEQHDALVALELATAGLARGGRAEREARRRVEERHGAVTVREAERAASRRFPRRRPRGRPLDRSGARSGESRGSRRRPRSPGSGGLRPRAGPSRTGARSRAAPRARSEGPGSSARAPARA